MVRFVWILLVLWSCAAATPRYGSFVTGRDEVLVALASDAADKLGSDYPPGDDSALAVVAPRRDAFGVALESALRKQGHRVRAAADRNATSVRYVADAIKGTRLLRMTLYVNGRSMSRAYDERTDGVHPVGPWTGREAGGGQ